MRGKFRCEITPFFIQKNSIYAITFCKDFSQDPLPLKNFLTHKWVYKENMLPTLPMIGTVSHLGHFFYGFPYRYFSNCFPIFNTFKFSSFMSGKSELLRSPWFSNWVKSTLLFTSLFWWEIWRRRIIMVKEDNYFHGQLCFWQYLQPPETKC